MKYKKFLIAQVEGNTIKDIIIGCDAITASLERKEMSRTSEAPDQSGRYDYKVTDIPIIDFSKYYELKKEKDQLQKELNKIKNNDKTKNTNKKIPKLY